MLQSSFFVFLNSGTVFLKEDKWFDEFPSGDGAAATVV